LFFGVDDTVLWNLFLGFNAASQLANLFLSSHLEVYVHLWQVLTLSLTGSQFTSGRS
jgi:hypothetical protein